jgi:hypothetical protein
VYAVGNNAEASFLAGINTRLVTVVLFMLSGMFAAMGGIVLVAFSGNPTLGLGDPYLLQSVAAIVIGGVSILGGPWPVPGHRGGRHHPGDAADAAAGAADAGVQPGHRLRRRDPGDPVRLRP